MLTLELTMTADQTLEECRRRGLVVTSQRALAGRPGSRHWHLRLPSHAGTLELNDWRGRVWVNVHPLREGEWVVAFARELASISTSESG